MIYCLLFWGLGIGDWGLGPNPTTPNPQSPIPIKIFITFICDVINLNL